MDFPTNQTDNPYTNENDNPYLKEIPKKKESNETKVRILIRGILVPPLGQINIWGKLFSVFC